MICPVCGAEFEKPDTCHGEKIYCSKKCRITSYHKRTYNGHIPKGPIKKYSTCIECGREYPISIFTSVESKYCSRRCRNNVTDRRKYHTFDKSDPESIFRNREYLKIWREQKARDGLCTRCGKNKTYGKRTCEECADRRNR